MFEFFQNQHNNEALIEKAKQIEAKFEEYLEDGHYYDRLINLLNRNMPEDDNDDTPSWTKNDDGHFSEKREDWFDGLPRKLRPEDYVKKTRYSDSESQRLKRIAMVGNDLDDNLINDNKFTEEYTSLVREFFQSVAVTATDKELSQIVLEDGHNVRQMITRWLGGISELMRSLKTQGLLYLDFTVRQTRMLLELFQHKVKKSDLTQRHLFLMGLKRLGINDLDFLSILFALNRFVDLATEPFYEFFMDLVIKKVTDINWINDPQSANIIRETLFDGFPFAESAYRKGKHKNYWKTVLKPYKVHYFHYFSKNISGRFKLKGNFNGFVGYRDIGNNKKEIIIGFSGTELCSIKNWSTNFHQFFGGLPLPYIQAYDIVESIWVGTRHKKGFKNAQIRVYGHSLGGGLMQYAVGRSSATDILGFGYNSAGLSFNNTKLLNYTDPQKQIYHLYNPCDVVFILPSSVQLGVAVRFERKTLEPITAHITSTIRRKINSCRKKNTLSQI